MPSDTDSNLSLVSFPLCSACRIVGRFPPLGPTLRIKRDNTHTVFGQGLDPTKHLRCAWLCNSLGGGQGNDYTSLLPEAPKLVPPKAREWRGAKEHPKSKPAAHLSIQEVPQSHRGPGGSFPEPPPICLLASLSPHLSSGRLCLELNFKPQIRPCCSLPKHPQPRSPPPSWGNT